MTSRSLSGGKAGEPLDRDALLGLAEQARVMASNDPRRLAASIAMFERLADHWSLRAAEREKLLGGVSKSTWSEWRGRRTSVRIKSDTRERIANLFLIDLNAHSLFAPEFADRWVREPNAAFQGESPMTTMLRGKVEDVIGVRIYLERIRTSSPTETSRSDVAASSQAVAISLLPGDAVQSNEEDETLAALGKAVAVYKRRAAEDPARYEQALASVLHAYTECRATKDIGSDRAIHDDVIMRAARSDEAAEPPRPDRNAGP